MQNSAESRPLLLATALADSASKKFQYTGLLLSHHTDVLCEFITDMGFEDTVSAASIPQASSQACRSKRKPRSKPPRAAKKAAHDE